MGKLFNRTMMTVSGTPGTGTITLGGAVSGYQTFAAAGVANGDVVSYIIEDGTNWEYGQGTYTSAGTLLARTTIQGSSNSGAAISASASARVFLSALATDVDKAVSAWTPALKFGGGSVGLTYNSQVGSYVQYNKLVVAEFLIVVNTLGSSTGAATITGLPATSDATLGGQANILFYSTMSGMSAPMCYVSNNTSTIILNFAGATGLTAMTNTNFGAGSTLYGIAIYLAA